MDKEQMEATTLQRWLLCQQLKRVIAVVRAPTGDTLQFEVYVMMAEL